ncbi:MAG: 8-oxo-dGTP diphosphatase [Lachnospiraceae bacterium]|nr:8-oxo-dGTP diphosphatase [Lachnospiraceae bacterium]MCI9370436.1 8-oxo-dGTP diphosphatase [Lachnospiraceae bacterium]
MRLTTICYIEKDEKYLMLHRTKKENDQSHDKWLGVGGKFEENESPDECVVREVKEETGLTLLSYKLRGVMTFVSDIWETEYMFIYTADRFEGELTECSEGELLWVEKSKVPDLNLWEGDILFLKKLMEDSEFFTIKVQYQGEKLIYAVEKSS